MIPAPTDSLRELATRLLQQIAPQTTNTYAATDTALIAQLLFGFAKELESGVADRLQDISDLQALFAQVPDDVPNHAALAAFGDRAPDSLCLSDVNVCLDQGQRLLIALHQWAELHDAALNQQIWQLLRRQTERHSFTLP